MTDEPKSKEIQKDFLCKNEKEADTLGIKSKGEKPEIKEFSTCKLTYPSCAQKNTQLEEEGLYDIVKEDEYQDYIERWFQKVTQSQYFSFLQHLLMQRQVSWFNYHIQVITATTFSYVYKGRIHILPFSLGFIGKAHILE